LKKIFVKPAQPEYVVRMPGNLRNVLPDAGALVDKTPFWIRRLRDGSVLEAKPPKGDKK